jgi:antitoxin MazE
MQVTITRIGNSQGIRIPKSILAQCGFTDTATIVIKDNQIIIAPTQPRHNWQEQFAQTKPTYESELIDFSNTWDQDEWQW